MTLVVAICQPDLVIIGGDRLISDDEGAAYLTPDPKVIRQGELLVGMAGAVECLNHMPHIQFDRDYWKVARQLRERKVSRDGEYLVASWDGGYIIDTTTKLSYPFAGEAVIGSAGEIAKGALWATRRWTCLEKRVRCALDAASHYRTDVRGPYDLITIRRDAQEVKDGGEQ